MKTIKSIVNRIAIIIKNIKRVSKPQDKEIKRKSLWKLLVIGAVPVIIALVIILTLLMPDSIPSPALPIPSPTAVSELPSPTSTLPQAPTTESISTPTPVITPLPPEIEKGLIILSHTTYIDKFGYFHIIGEVKNLDEYGAENNRVRADFYNDQGIIYSTSTGECFRELIGPGGKSPFEIIFSEVPETLTYILTTLSQSTENLPAGGFSFTEVFLESGVDSEYIVKGIIHNDSNYVIEIALILGTFYDNDGNVTAIGFTFPDITTIQPGGSSEFTMMIDSHGNTIVNFALHVETSTLDVM